MIMTARYAVARRRAFTAGAALLALAAAALSPSAVHAQDYPEHAIDLSNVAGLSLTIPEGYRSRASVRNLLSVKSGDGPTKKQLEARFLSIVGPHNANGLLSGISGSVRPVPENVTTITPEMEKALPIIVADSAFDAVVLKTAHITVAKEPALSIAVKYTAYQEERDERYEIRGRTILVLHNHKLYTFSFQGPADHFNQDVKAFEKLIGSIVWSATVKAPTEAEKPATGG